MRTLDKGSPSVKVSLEEEEVLSSWVSRAKSGGQRGDSQKFCSSAQPLSAAQGDLVLGVALCFAESCS